MMILPAESSSVSRPSGETPQHMQPGLERSMREATTSRTPSGASRPKRSTKPSVERSCSVSPVSSPWRTATRRSVSSGPTPSETPSIGFVSASRASTSCPARESARAMVPDTVVLPTPPFPATTIFIGLCYRHLAWRPNPRSRGWRGRPERRRAARRPPARMRARRRRRGPRRAAARRGTACDALAVRVAGHLVDDERERAVVAHRARDPDDPAGGEHRLPGRLDDEQEALRVRRPVVGRLARTGRQVAEDDPVVERAHARRAGGSPDRRPGATRGWARGRGGRSCRSAARARRRARPSRSAARRAPPRRP